MPGIVGLITRIPRQRAEPLLLRMVERLQHESFYVTGTWIDEELGVYVGWVAREGSFSANMPLRDGRNENVLVFSGEDYSRCSSSAPMAVRSDGQDGPGHILERRHDDPAFPESLNGRFQGLLIDRPRGCALLFNDRYGMHRVYYHESADAFYFAAEAKAILAVCPELRRVDPRGLGDLVSCGCVLENRSLFEGLKILPPGSAWTFRPGASVQKSFYFQPREWEEQTPLEHEAYYEELKSVFTRNLPRYFEGRERIGMSLTGGFDTRMVMAWQKCPAGSLPCYTFGSAFHENRDVIIARRVARACEQPHRVIVAGADLLGNFARYAERTVYLTDGCTSVNHAPVLYSNENARAIAPVRMTGNYGDQIILRLRAFKPSRLTPSLFHPDFAAHVNAGVETYRAATDTHPLTFAAFRQAPWFHYGLAALEHTQLTLRTPYLDNDFVRTNYRAPQSALASNEVRLRLIAEGNPSLRQIATDRASSSSIAITAALVHAYQELTFKAEYAYDYGMPPLAARADHLVSWLHLERLFLGRHKYYHFRVWYRDALSKYVREMLLDERTLSRPYWDRRAVEAVVRGHLVEGKNYTSEIHTLLTVELIHRLFVDTR
jgi:asparagine synthase (glutamine-hydrolysing)